MALVGRRLLAREPQRPLELPGSLAVRCQRAGAPARRHRMLQGGRAVAGLLGVKGQPGIVVTADSAQSLQYPGMEFGTPGRAHRLLDGLPRDLVPETHHRMAGHQPGCDDLGQRGPGHDVLEQPLVDGAADHSRRIQGLPGLRPEAPGAGQDHIPG